MIVNTSRVEVERAHDGDIHLSEYKVRIESCAYNLVPLHLYSGPLDVYLYMGRVGWMVDIS